MNTLELSKKIEFKSYNAPTVFNRIIGLSGASGFLGLHLIEQLLKDKSIEKIKCFIRSRDKFNQKKKEFKLHFDESRLEFFTDLKASHFCDIGHFVHSAAHLNSLKSVDQLFSDNVALTQEILSHLKGKMHFISTLSVFASSNLSGVHATELIQPSLEHVLYGGYAQSKWLSEHLVSRYPDYQIIRLGLLTPSHANPVFQTHEFSYILINMLKDTKVYPENYQEAYVDMSPVDSVAQLIVQGLSSDKKITHIAAKKSTALSTILNLLDAQPVPKEKWLESIKKYKKTYQILLLYTFFKKEALEQYAQYYNIDLFQSTTHDWQGQIDTDIIADYIQEMKNIG